MKHVLKLRGDGTRSSTATHREPLIDHTVCTLVSTQFKIDIHDLRSRRRAQASISDARQIVMYLLHTKLRYTLSDAGKYVGRDRTTVRHACRKVEDRRDNTSFDEILTGLEQLIDDSFVIPV